MISTLKIDSKNKKILVVLPTARDRKAISSELPGESLYWLDDPSFNFLDPSPDFNLVNYIEKCSRTIQEHSIDGLLYSHDIASLAAAVLSERHGLPGPSVESMFLCTHKYYSRKKESNPIWFDVLHLDQEIHDSFQYPLYLKPPCLLGTLFQYRINDSIELQDAVSKLKRELPVWNQTYFDFSKNYVDLKRYPLAIQNVLLLEELVENATQHCVEGWVEPDGTIHIWAVSDSNYFEDGHLAIDNYSTPSRLSFEWQEEIIQESMKTVANHGIKNGFWNVEIWIRKGICLITEVNSRSASVWHEFYRNTYRRSLYEAMFKLACGEVETCRALAPPRPSPGSRPQRYGGQFHVVTYGEGKADELLNFPFIESIPTAGVTVFPKKDDLIRQTRTAGFWLARFELYGNSYEEICREADDLRQKMLLKPQWSPAEMHSS